MSLSVTRASAERFGDRCVDGLPLGKKLREELCAIRSDPIEALVPFFFLAPFAGQQSLRLEPAEERIAFWFQGLTVSEVVMH